VGAVTDRIRSTGGGSERGAILVVEDEPGVARVLQTFLGQRGHEVVVAPTLGAAGEACRARQFDCVIVDKNLPDGDGADAVTTFRSATNGAPVLVMTAYPTVPSAVGAMNAGAVDYIAKPFDLGTVLSVVDAAIRRRRREIASLEARAAADRLRELFEVVLESMADPVIAIGDDGAVLCANRAARILYGYGDHFPERIDALERDAASMQAVRRRVFSGEHVGEHRCRRRTADDGNVDVVLSLRPLARAGASEIHGVLETSRTVAEMARTQAGIIESEKVRSLGRLTAGIAHEINNPISYVLSNLERLREYSADLAGAAHSGSRLAAAVRAAQAAGGAAAPDASEDLEEALSVVEGAAAALARDGVEEELGAVLDETRDGARQVATIVKDIRQLARSGSGKVERVDPVGIMEHAAGIMRSKLKRVPDVVRALHAPPGAVFGVSERLVQVVINLIDNACYAVEKHGGSRVTLGVEPLDEKVRLVVEDDGPGVPPAVRPRLFDPFYTTKPPGEGTGLGLSIAFQIAREHGGTLTLEEGAGGRGARFVLELPAPRLSGRAVLMIEAEEGDAPRETLESEGATVTVAASADAARHALSQRRYDLVVVPCGASFPGGIDLLEEVRSVSPLAVRIGVAEGSSTWNASTARDERAHLWVEDLTREAPAELLCRALAMQHALEAV